MRLIFGKTESEKKAIENKKLLEMKDGIKRFAFGLPVKLADGRWLFFGEYFEYYKIHEEKNGDFIPYNYWMSDDVVSECYLDKNEDHIIKINTKPPEITKEEYKKMSKDELFKL